MPTSTHPVPPAPAAPPAPLTPAAPRRRAHAAHPPGGSGHRRSFALAALAVVALTLVPAACNGGEAPVDGQPAPDAPEAATTVRVYFTRGEQPAPVERRVPSTPRILRATLLELLEGPTAEERAAGYSSFFSGRTAGMLNAVMLDAQGRAIVDFDDLRPVIPNASTSAGSRMLLGELNATVFQFPNVRSVEYRIDGSCAAFWEWLQRECQVVRRPGG